MRLYQLPPYAGAVEERRHSQESFRGTQGDEAGRVPPPIEAYAFDWKRAVAPRARRSCLPPGNKPGGATVQRREDHLLSYRSGGLRTCKYSPVAPRGVGRLP